MAAAMSASEQENREHELQGDRQMTLGKRLEMDLFRMGDCQQSVPYARSGACPVSSRGRDRLVAPGDVMLQPRARDCKWQMVRAPGVRRRP